MNCFWCKTELILGGTIDIDSSINSILHEEYSMMSNLTCPKCYSVVEVLKKRDAYD